MYPTKTHQDPRRNTHPKITKKNQKTRLHDQTYVKEHYYTYYQFRARARLVQISIRCPHDYQKDRISTTRHTFRDHEGPSPTQI